MIGVFFITDLKQVKTLKHACKKCAITAAD